MNLTDDTNALLLFCCAISRSTRDNRLHSHIQGVPDKGKILTKISLFWFNKLKHILPTHFVTANIDEMPEEVRQYKDQLEGRTMLVKKAKVIPLEAIVRGYLTGKYPETHRTRLSLTPGTRLHRIRLG